MALVCAFELFGMAQAIFLSMGTYNAIKSFVGRLRPNFFAACDYKGYGTGLRAGNLTAYLAATVPGAVGDVAHCLAPLEDVDEASLSFPSGHAAMSFAGMTYATLALAAVARVIAHTRKRGDGSHSRGGREVFPRGVSPWLAAACLPLSYAVYVSCTRVTDYKHRPEDVLAGAVIGVASALACRPAGTGGGSDPIGKQSGGGGGGGGGAEEMALIAPGAVV